MQYELLDVTPYQRSIGFNIDREWGQSEGIADIKNLIGTANA